MNGYGRGDNNEKKEKRSVVTKETAGMTLLLFSALAFLIAVTRSLMFGEVGIAITAFLLGCFGYLTYPLLIALIYTSLVMVFGKRWIARKWLVTGGLLLCAIFLIVHLATSSDYANGTYGEYLSACYRAGEEGVSTSTGGGVIFALVVFPFRKVLSTAGAYVIFAFLVAIALFFLLRSTALFDMIKRKGLGARRPVHTAEDSANPAMRTERNGVRAYPAAVSFDEIAAPTRTAMPPRGEQPIPAPVAEQPKPASDGRAETYRHSRDILFSTDPATSYKNNLIFDRDSSFNNRERYSSETPVRREPVPNETVYKENVQESVRPTYPAATEGESSYLNSYSQQAETTRPAMPRKIVEPQQPQKSGFMTARRNPLSLDDVNYAEKPSYRAVEPEPSPAQTRDYYRNDVEPEPYEEEYSSAPNVEDVPAEPTIEQEEVRPQFTREREFPQEETRTQFIREETRNQFTREDSLTEESSEEEPLLDRSEPLRPFGFGKVVDSDQSVPVEEEEEDNSAVIRERESEFRNLFSRPVSGRDSLRPSLPLEEEEEQTENSRVFRGNLRGEESASNLLDDDLPEEEEYDDTPVEEVRSRIFDRPVRGSVLPVSPVDSSPAPQPQKHIYKQYIRPPFDLLRDYEGVVSVPQEEIERNSAIIVETLAGFRVDAEIVKVTCGSSVTRYDIDIPRNISVSSVIKHDEEIAMRLHARDGVNMYSNRERGAISIEVPNSHRATVGVKAVMQSDEFLNSKPNSRMFAIGKDVEGRNVCGDITMMKHILVAGATGSGKSVCLNAMLVSLICKYSPEDLRLILIDPKTVEFSIFAGIPHLMINEIIKDAQKAVTALNWAIKEMERRYLMFTHREPGRKIVPNIDEYNDDLTDSEEKLAKIVIVVDELADLMSVAKKEIEERIQRLTQKARAAGIYLVIATQRPSVDVITGVIKGNLPTRMAFRVIQEVDSRTILDESGAEKLLGNGDMLYRTEGMFDCSRVQGAFLSSSEVQAIVENIKANNEAYFDETVADYINSGNQTASSDDSDDSEGGPVDPIYIKALGIVVKLGTASISLIQRKCSVGYNHAGRIIEWMEVMGYISPFEGKAKARPVLLTKEEYESKYGSLD